MALKLGGKTFLLPREGRFQVGSRDGADLTLPDPALEEIHCELLPSSQGIRLVDLSGKTFLEGEPVGEVDLRPGMRLLLGRTPLEAIRLEEAERTYLVRVPPKASGKALPFRDASRALRRYQQALGPTFADQMARRTKDAPWLALALGAHLVLLFLLWNLPLFPSRQEFFPGWTGLEPKLENEILPEEPAPGRGKDSQAWDPALPEPPGPEPFLEDRTSPDPLEDPAVYLGLMGGSYARKVLLAGGGSGPGGKAKKPGLLDPRLRGTAPAFRRTVGELRSRGLDAVLVVDATASMTFGLQLLRETLLDLLYAQAALVPDNRTALVVFRDRREDPSCRLPAPKTSLARDPWEAMNLLGVLRVGGGGGPRESLLAPLQEAFAIFTEGSRRRRVVLLFGDAPGPSDEEKVLRSAVSAFHRAGGILCTVYTGPPPERSPFHGEELEEFRLLARLGGGRCVSLAGKARAVRELLGLLAGGGREEDLERFLASLEAAPPIRIRAARKEIRTGRTGRVLRRMARPPVPPGLVREILGKPDRPILRGLLGFLDRSLPERPPRSSRLAALYVLQRSLPPFPLTQEEIREGYLSPENRRRLLRLLGGP